MTISRARALLVVGSLVVFALVLGGIAVASDKNSSTDTIAGCDGGDAVTVADTKVPAAAKVAVRVFNSTSRVGLASEVANQLKSRGFRVDKTGNDPEEAALEAIGEVRYGIHGIGSARLLAATINGLEPVPDNRLDATVDVVLGERYNGLVSQGQVASAMPTVPHTADCKKSSQTTNSTVAPQPAE